MKQQKYEIHSFYCSKCGFEIPLPRKKSKRKEPAHLKRLYCIRCKEEINFIEDNQRTFFYNEFIKELQDNEKEG